MVQWHHFGAQAVPIHLTDITLHEPAEAWCGPYPVMTFFFQRDNDITGALQNALYDFDDSQFILNAHDNHQLCHPGGPMPTADPYLSHLHFTSSIFGMPDQFMVFHTLVTLGFLNRGDVDPLMRSIFGMVALQPKSQRRPSLPPLSAEEREKTLQLARRQGFY